MTEARPKKPRHKNVSPETTFEACGVPLPLVDELSSMGIRVDAAALRRQLAISDALDRQGLLFHRRLLAGELPLSIGGGIGQSRLCMLYLRKAHIGEIQSSMWPEDMIRTCRAHNIHLL